jgi:uncharacterized protein (TIGR02001 family)
MRVSRSVAALCGIAGVSLAAFSGAAVADDKLTWSATITGTSEYVFRGISQTDEDPTIQGSIGVGYGMFYGGVWASGLDFGDDAQLEVDYYAGIKPTWDHSPLGAVTFDFGVIYYAYPGYSLGDSTEYVEYKAGYSIASSIIKGLTTGTTVFYSSDYSLNTGEVWTTESVASYSLPNVGVFAPTVSGLLGWQSGDFSEGYNAGGTDDEYYYWNAGLTLAVEKLSFDFRYWDTDLDAGGLLCGNNVFQCDERFVFTATVALP